MANNTPYSSITPQRSTTFTCRADIRILKLLHEFFQSRGVAITNRSEIANYALEFLAESLLSRYPELSLSTYHEAMGYLQHFGLANLNAGGRGKEQLKKVLASEALELDFDVKEKQKLKGEVEGLREKLEKDKLNKEKEGEQ